MIEKFKQWFEYEKKAHSLTLKSLDTVPAENRNSRELQKAIDLLGHLVNARLLWLSRMGRLQDPPGSLFPQNLDINELNRMIENMNKIWNGYFEELDPKESDRIFKYKSTENLWYTNQVEEILVQLFGHSLYHRGQIAQLVRLTGGEPAETDFVYYTRKEIPAED